MEYKTEDIGGIQVCVSKEHTFGTDAFLLADFAGPGQNDRICDLGCGCGIIPLLFLRDNNVKRIAAVDIQRQAIDQLKESIRINKLENRLFPALADLRELKGVVDSASFDLVTCNPPYYAGGSGVMSRGNSDRIARHETLCTIGDCCAAASKLLRFGGRFCVCYPPERLADLIFAMRLNKIEPKRMRFVQKDQDSAPWLVLIEGRRGSKPYMKTVPALLLYEGGATSREMQRIYKSYGKITF